MLVVSNQFLDSMKKMSIALAALVLLMFSSCRQQYETVAGDPLGTKIYTLDNGLKIYMSVNKEQPRIQTYMAVKVGSKNDPPQTTGLAHYFEHLMFKGTQQFGTSDYAAEKPMLDQIEQLFEVYRVTEDEDERKAIYHKIDSISYEASKIAIPNEYDKLMALIGADGTNAWTSTDETVYTEDIPSNQIDNWARIQADRFRNVVIRGFHTELETIYEEKNMYITQDRQKIWDSIDAALYPNHPYGQQTTIGSQEHLKNPSITNVKNYHHQYYVPNNIAICVSGDFEPKEMVAAIEKYFGDWQPNPSIPVLKYKAEEPITSPIVREVYGLEAETMAMAWRTPGERDFKTTAIADVVGRILNNGSAGLIDINVNQAQRALNLAAGPSPSPDYSCFVVMGQPKQGQSLDELRDIALEQVELLRRGEFDESLIRAIINNFKLSEMRSLESNSARARQYVDAFIAGVDWKDACKEIERYESVTKEDVVAFANKYLDPQSYAIVYKRQGEDKSVQKIAAPAITPIVTNRDKQSAFLQEIASTEVKPIEPVFVDFAKEMSVSKIADAAEILYKRNELNDIFTLNIRFPRGNYGDPALGVAADYISYLGTDKLKAEEIATKLFDLACSFYVSVGSRSTTLVFRGLGENMEEAISIVEDLVANAVADEEVLTHLKNDILESRLRNKKSQSACNSSLIDYVVYGPDYVKNTNLSNAELASLTSTELIDKVRKLLSEGHQIIYYGPMSESEFRAAIDRSHKIGEGAVLAPEQFTEAQATNSSSVVLAQYDANQINYHQYSNRGEKFDIDSEANLNLYNEYFGGGMNTVVFQEMREARGLAYSAWARLYFPGRIDGTYYYRAFIATQNDKMRQAIEAFEEIINNMPQSEASFKVAKDALTARLRTQRIVGVGVLNSFIECRRYGISEPTDRLVFEKVQNLTLQDIVATQQKWVKDRDYTYAILGDIKNLDTDYLRTLGPVKVVSLEDIFGY